jgi:hypothetical protein
MDMSAFIVAKSDQLNADDLLGGPRTITITGVRGTDASDQPVAVSYEGDAGKPFKPCKSMRRVMVHCWGKDATKYTGRSMTIYCDPDVQFGGMKVGGIRISHMSGLEAKKQMALTATRGKKGLYTVQPLKDAPERSQERETTDPAVTWSEGFIARLAGFQTTSEGDAFINDRKVKLAELEAKRPDLFAKVDAAITEFTARTRDNSFDNDDLSAPSTQSQNGGGYDGV